MSRELPEFSDDLAHCDPCGWPEADTLFVPAIAGAASVDRRINPFGGSWPVFAFLKRTCQRCGFQWAEAPLLPRDQPDGTCDVLAMSGARCVLWSDHFETTSHKFGPKSS